MLFSTSCTIWTIKEQYSIWIGKPSSGPTLSIVVAGKHFPLILIVFELKVSVLLAI